MDSQPIPIPYLYQLEWIYADQDVISTSASRLKRKLFEDITYMSTLKVPLAITSITPFKSYLVAYNIH